MLLQKLRNFLGLAESFPRSEAQGYLLGRSSAILCFAAFESQYYGASISKQILFSDWYAHYKFFWQYQIDWVANQKNFSFWRDKVPLTGWLATAAIIVSIASCFAMQFDSVKSCFGIA